MALGLFVVGAVWLLSRTAVGGGPGETRGGDVETAGRQRTYLPTGPSDQVVHHAYYSLGYDEDWEQARWVAYELSPGELADRSVRRTDDFRPDPDVKTRSAERADYRGSGYSRGHQVPAGDMNFDARAMSETFLYSNISPQLEGFNGGVWRELEETSREWMRGKGNVYVVTGPIVGASPRRIGGNRVAVPRAFWRCMLSRGGESVAFLVEHAVQTAPLANFRVSIDSIEAATGLDLFPELTHTATEALEASANGGSWPNDERRYRKRLASWNKR